MQYNYDYFISYAHKDNKLPDGVPGFVNEFVMKLKKDTVEHQQIFGGEIRVFFDEKDIRDMSDWDNRIRSCLASSRFLIVLLSPNYFQSEYCAKEFDWWMKHEMHRCTLGEGTAPMIISNVGVFDPTIKPAPEIPAEIQVRFPNWLKQIQKIQSDCKFDMHEFLIAKIDSVLKTLRDEVKDKVRHQKIVDRLKPDSYPGYNENFVGRRENLLSLRKYFSSKSSKAIPIAALTGLGGIGKTELALTYGHAFGWDYQLGRFFKPCENCNSIYEAFLSSGIQTKYHWDLEGETDEEQLIDLFQKLKAEHDNIVLQNSNSDNLKNDAQNPKAEAEGLKTTNSKEEAEILKAENEKFEGAHLLLILDNVSNLNLITQLLDREIPIFIHVIITTRKTTKSISAIHTESVESLSEDESVELLNNLRLFDNPDEARAARDIAHLLAGFTLVVEITGAYLANNESITYQEHYDQLNKDFEGVSQIMVDELLTDEKNPDEPRKLKRHTLETIATIIKTPLSALSVEARKALDFASLMPPDAVALDWIPELLGYNWNSFINELTRYCLAVRLKNERKIARMHRLVADTVNQKIPDETRKEIIAKIREKCNTLLKKDETFWHVPGNFWNITLVSEFLKLVAQKVLAECESRNISETEYDRDLTMMMETAGNILKSLDKIYEAYEVYHLRYEICKRWYESFRDNNDIFQDYCSSCKCLQNLQALFALLSEKEESVGNTINAQKNLGMSQRISKEIQGDIQEIRTRLAEMMPKNVVMQQELIASYNNLGDLEMSAGNTVAAREWYRMAMEISQKKVDAESKRVGTYKEMLFDYYISYSHKDNESEDDESGFVDEFVKKLKNSPEHQQMFGGEIKIFFDKSIILDMSDWDERIRSGLANSRFLIILLSANYFKSVYRAREFEWWMQHEMHRLLLDEGVIPILIDSVYDASDSNASTLPAIPPVLQAKYPHWASQIRHIHLDPNFDMSSFDRSKIDKTVKALVPIVKDRIIRQELAKNSPINTLYPRYNENFVGRRDDLRALRKILSANRGAAYLALTGLGGFGKTELALTYGHAFAWDYQLGRVFAKCENITSLNEILLTSGIAEMHGWDLPNGSEEQQIAFLFDRLKVKRNEIVKRNSSEGRQGTLGAHILLILDNVNNLDLIRQEKLSVLPDYFHVVITTRENLNQFPYIHSEQVDRLSIDESVELLSNLRSFGPDPAEAEAARKISMLLDGFTIEVELTGVYLRKHPSVTYQKQYEDLVISHPDVFQRMADSTYRLTRHSADTVAAVLESTLSALSDNARKALNFASLMAPDAVGFAWLPELVGLKDNEGRGVLQELKGYSLLTPLQDEPNIARIHRLVAASLEIPEEEQKEIVDKIREKCCELLEKDETFWCVSENIWNITSVSEFCLMLTEHWTVETTEEEIDSVLTRALIIAGDLLRSLGRMNKAKEVYQRCLEISEERIEKFPSNIEICRDLNVLYEQLGDLEKDLENVTDSWKWYMKSLDIRLQLSEQFGDAVVLFRRDLSVLYDKLGDLAKDVANIDAAREWYRKALDIQKQLGDDTPDDDEAMRDLSVTFQRLGDLEKNSGNIDAAREWYEEDLEICLRQVKKLPEDIKVNRSLSVSYMTLGDMEKDAGNIAAAREWYIKEQEVLKFLIEKLPKDVWTLRGMSILNANLGDLEKDSGNLDAARTWFEKALEIHRMLVDLMPENHDVHRDLSVSYNNLGDLEKAAGNIAAARKWYEKAMEIDHRLANQMPENVVTQQDLSITYSNLGDMEKAAGNAVAAREWYKKALEIDHRIVDQMPENMSVYRVLKHSYNRLGDMEKDAGNLAAARECYEKALEIEYSFADKMPTYITSTWELSVSYMKLGSIENSIGNTDDARALFEKSLEICKRQVILMPDDVDLQNNLIALYIQLGDLEKGSGNAAAARTWYENALENARLLADKMPENVFYQLNFGLLNGRLGDLEKDAGNIAAAREWYEKALRIYNRLAEYMPENVDVKQFSYILKTILENLENNTSDEQ